ncbi:hypothetical protein HY612_02090 [Candidatus Roizmanbacteria bacterium]|nr:hypothetical protein [Candidatus Roizmanbacteria bacterium]
MDKVRIKIENNTYYIKPDTENPVQQSGDRTALFIYLLYTDNDDVIGCISVCWTRTARAVAIGLSFNNKSEEELAYLALLQHLPLDLEKIKNRFADNHHCFMFMFNTSNEGFSPDNKIYSIAVKGGFEKTAQRIIFGAEPSDDQIRRKILTTLHDYWTEDPQTYMPLDKIKFFLPVSAKALYRNLYFLLDDKLIDAVISTHSDPQQIVTVKILNKGIKHIEDQSEFSVKFPSELIYQKFTGDQINATTSGDNSPVIINSQNINIAFSEIEAEIQKKDFSNKKEVLKLVDSLKTEVKKENNYQKIKSILEELKTEAKWVNEKIVKHPIIAQIVAQSFAKILGII